MTLTVRPAKRRDGQLIVDLVRELAAYEREPNSAKAKIEDVEMALFSGAPKVFCIIGEWSGEPCAFAVYFFNFSTWTGKHGVYLEDLFVRESFRGRGIGKALLATLAKIARDNDCARLEWSVLDWNEPAIQFYKMLGAVSMDGWTIYRMTDAALEELSAAAR